VTGRHQSECNVVNNVFRALVFYTVKYIDIFCGCPSAQEINYSEGVLTTYDVLMHGYRIRSYLSRNYEATKQACFRGKRMNSKKQWYEELSCREREADIAYYRRFSHQRDTTGCLFKCWGLVPWTHVCSDDIVDKVQREASKLESNGAKSSLMNENCHLVIPGFSSTKHASYLHCSEIVSGLNWNMFGISVMMLFLLDPAFQRLPSPENGKRSMETALPSAVYSTKFLFEVSLPAFITLLHKANTSQNSILRSNCMSLALLLGGKRYGKGHMLEYTAVEVCSILCV